MYCDHHSLFLGTMTALTLSFLGEQLVFGSWENWNENVQENLLANVNALAIHFGLMLWHISSNSQGDSEMNSTVCWFLDLVIVESNMLVDTSAFVPLSPS